MCIVSIFVNCIERIVSVLSMVAVFLSIHLSRRTCYNKIVEKRTASPKERKVFMKKFYESATADVIEISYLDILTMSGQDVSSAPDDEDLLDPI